MSALNDLLLATNNPKKIKEIQEIIGNDYRGRLLCASDYPEIADPEETGDTFAANARLKADYYAGHTGLISLADDSGLIVDALDGRPGVLSARYAPTDAEKISKLLTELTSVPDQERTARFMCAICVCLPNGERLEEFGTLEGRIGHSPRGTNGFGYDPVFVVDGMDLTLAELRADEKNSISHRGVAMKKIRPALLNALIRV